MSAVKYFKHAKRVPNILRRVEELVGTGATPLPPRWYFPAKHYPPLGPEVIPKKASVKELEFETDALLKKYYERNPEARKNQQVNLRQDISSFPAAVFVARQRDLMRTGMSYEESYDRVLAEQGADRRKTSAGFLPPSSATSNACDEDSRVTREYLAHFFGGLSASSFSSPAWRSSFGDELVHLDKQFGRDTDAVVKRALAIGRNVYRVRTSAMKLAKLHLDVLRAEYNAHFILAGYRKLLRSEWHDHGPESPFFDPDSDAIAGAVRQANVVLAQAELRGNHSRVGSIMTNLVGVLQKQCNAVRLAVDKVVGGKEDFSDEDAAQVHEALRNLHWKRFRGDLAELTRVTGMGFPSLDRTAKRISSGSGRIGDVTALRDEFVAFSMKLGSWKNLFYNSISPSEAQAEMGAVDIARVAGGRLVPIAEDAYFHVLGSIAVESSPSASNAAVYAFDASDLLDRDDDPAVSPWYETRNMTSKASSLKLKYHDVVANFLWREKDEAWREDGRKRAEEAAVRYCESKSAGIDVLLAKHAPLSDIEAHKDNIGASESARALQVYFFNHAAASMAMKRYEASLDSFYSALEGYGDELVHEHGVDAFKGAYSGDTDDLVVDKLLPEGDNFDAGYMREARKLLAGADGVAGIRLDEDLSFDEDERAMMQELDGIESNLFHPDPHTAQKAADTFDAVHTRGKNQYLRAIALTSSNRDAQMQHRKHPLAPHVPAGTALLDSTMSGKAPMRASPLLHFIDDAMQAHADVVDEGIFQSNARNAFSSSLKEFVDRTGALHARYSALAPAEQRAVADAIMSSSPVDADIDAQLVADVFGASALPAETADGERAASVATWHRGSRKDTAEDTSKVNSGEEDIFASEAFIDWAARTASHFSALDEAASSVRTGTSSLDATALKDVPAWAMDDLASVGTFLQRESKSTGCNLEDAEEAADPLRRARLDRDEALQRRADVFLSSKAKAEDKAISANVLRKLPRDARLRVIDSTFIEKE